MKIFIAGARSNTIIDNIVIHKLRSICDKGFDVLVGDCYGIDTVVQSYFADHAYSNVTVYASNGRARNNVGRWPVKNIPVVSATRGFEFFRQKDSLCLQSIRTGKRGAVPHLQHGKTVPL